MAWDPEAHKRLSDRVLEALNLAIEQDDVDIAEMLVSTLELAVTRGAGGPDFVERRDFSEDMEKALDKFDELKVRLRA